MLARVHCLRCLLVVKVRRGRGKKWRHTIYRQSDTRVSTHVSVQESRIWKTLINCRVTFWSVMQAACHSCSRHTRSYYPFRKRKKGKAALGNNKILYLVHCCKRISANYKMSQEKYPISQRYPATNHIPPPANSHYPESYHQRQAPIRTCFAIYLSKTWEKKNICHWGTTNLLPHLGVFQNRFHNPQL